MSFTVMITNANIVQAWDFIDECFIARIVAHHAMSEGEVAQGSLASQEKDGGVGPAEQGVPGRGVWSYLLQSQAGHNMGIDWYI